MTTVPDLPVESRHPDTVLVDELTAFLNREHEPSGSDVVALLCGLLSASGRPLLIDTWEFAAEVTEDRHGLFTVIVTAGTYTVRVFQVLEDTGGLHVAITSSGTDADRDGLGLAVTVDGRLVLDSIAGSWRATIPPAPRLGKEPHRQ